MCPLTRSAPGRDAERMSDAADTQAARPDVDGDGSGASSSKAPPTKPPPPPTAPGVLSRWRRWRNRELPSVELRKTRGLIDVRHFELDRLLGPELEHEDEDEATKHARKL